MKSNVFLMLITVLLSMFDPKFTGNLVTSLGPSDRPSACGLNWESSASLSTR